MKFLEDNIKFYLLITIITFISYFQLFLKGNFFNFYELDIHVLYDYLFRSNLNGWRLDKILGTNMLIGDPSFHAWSFLSLIYKIPLINKILLHNIIFLIINLYASFSLFYLITYSNPKLNKYYASLISSLIFLSILRLEFNYVFSWALVFPTIILSTITLFNFFKTNHHKYIFKLFMIYFIGFNFGSIFVIQQSLIFSFLFFIFYSIYFKQNIILNYFKIIALSLSLLFFSSMWIFFPYIYEIIFSNEELVRTANYKAYDLIEIDLSIFKIIFNTFFGAFINMGDINLPDREITPSYHWNNTLPVFFNLILLFFILAKDKGNFWIFLSKNIIIVYLVHVFLSEISPFYYSLNLFVIDTMTWSKVNIEIYIFQLLLLSFFLSGDYNLSLKKPLKFYCYVLLIYLTIFILFSLDVFLNFNLTKIFFKKFIILLDVFNLYIFENEKSLNLFINDVYKRFNFIIDVKFLLIQITSLILILIAFFNLKFLITKSYKFIFLIFIILNNYLTVSHFTPIEKNNFNLWQNAINQNIIGKDERLISLSQNYLFNIKNQNVDIKKLNEQNIKEWIDRNPIENKKKYYGIMSPPFLSFSSNASFVNKKLSEDSSSLFEIVPKKIKDGFTASNSFEILQEGIYNINYVNNLSIKYAYSVFDLEKHGLLKKYLKPYWNDGNLYIYEILGSNQYSYVAKSINYTNKDIHDFKIKDKEVYLSKKNYQNYKNLNIGPADFKLSIINNSSFNIYYKSNYKNIIVISNSFHKNWKHNSNDNIQIIKVNKYFTGLVVGPGEFNFKFYFDNSKYFPGIYFSSLFIIIIIIFYLKNFLNIRK